MINYYMPGFYECQTAYKRYFYLRDHYPECFYDNVNIKKIYGCFPNMIWNGGGAFFGLGVSRQEIYDTFHFYADKGVQLQITCTNPVLEESDVYDRFGNTVLQIASEFDFIEVLVSSPILEEYIRKTYPKLKIDKSIIATTRDRDTDSDNLEFYLGQLEKYNMIVFPRKYSKDIDFLTSVPEDKRDKFEVLATDPCPIYCPRLYSHYEDMGRRQLLCANGELGCTSFNDGYPFKSKKFVKFQMKYPELVETYEPLGYTEIKISGRIFMTDMVLLTSEYLIKPEYRHDVMVFLFEPYRNIPVYPDFSYWD